MQCAPLCPGQLPLLSPPAPATGLSHVSPEAPWPEEQAQPCSGRDTGFHGSPAACELRGLPLGGDTRPIAGPASRGCVAAGSGREPRWWSTWSEAPGPAPVALTAVSWRLSHQAAPGRGEARKALFSVSGFLPALVHAPRAPFGPGCPRPPARISYPAFPTDSPRASCSYDGVSMRMNSASSKS